MGIKAVSAPILASETAVGYWRGSTILAWQLWFVFILTPVSFLLIIYHRVACGIMIGLSSILSFPLLQLLWIAHLTVVLTNTEADITLYNVLLLRPLSLHCSSSSQCVSVTRVPDFTCDPAHPTMISSAHTTFSSKSGKHE